MHKTALLLSVFALSLGVAVVDVSAQSQRASPDNKSGDIENVKSSSAGFQIEPVPKWVLAAPKGDSGRVVKASMHYELMDEQDKLDSHGAAAYTHMVRVIDTVDGLSAASEIRVDFNPSYETLAFHKIEILRNGARIDKLERSKVKLLRRESNLERQMYDGVVTASLILEDARVGDRIEIAYSIRGVNPVFEGHYVHTAWLASSRGPVKTARFRLLAPENRVVLHRTGDDVVVKETLHDGLRDTEFLRASVTQLHGDQYTPASTYLDEQIGLSEFSDWSEVVRWGEGLFAVAQSAPSELVKKTAQSLVIKADASDAEKLRLVLNFVQKEVRYFGTEIGENSHRPSSPDAVIRQRFGDCKDKTLLLVALLKALGVDAVPVLVSTQYRSDVDPQFYSPLQFDHAIARVYVDGRQYWLDGTRTGQTGSLMQRQSVGLGKGLVLSGGVTSLVDLPGTESEERVDVEEIYRVKKLSEAPVLELRSTYSGEVAEMVREAMASQPRETFKTSLNADFSRFHPNSQEISPLQVEELPERNAVRIVQTFAVPKFWRFPDEKQLTGDYMLWNLIGPMNHTEETARSQPFQIAYPGIYRHSVVLEFQEDMTKNVSSKQAHEEDAHLYFQVDWDVEPRKYTVSSELRTLKSRVDIAEWPAYTGLLRKISANLGGAFFLSPVSSAQADRLNQDVRNLVESWQGLFAKNRPVTEVQSRAMVNRLILTAELEGGRLTPELRAQVLHKRGIQLDNLGLFDLARADFDEALKLQPEEGSILADAAVNCFESGQDALALDYAKKALALDPSSHDPQRTLAYAHYFARNYGEASRNLLSLLKTRSEINEGYSTIWLYLAARRNNEEAAAVVKPYLARNQSAWPHPLLQYLMGSRTLEQALEVARAGQKDQSRLCELYFYVGEKYLIEGNAAQAREYFKKSMDTGVIEFNEYVMSKRSLQRMGEL